VPDESPTRSMTDDLQQKFRAQEALSPEQEGERREARNEEKRLMFLRRKQGTDSDGQSSDQSPEAKTPEMDEWCRMCNTSRTEIKPQCVCGVAYLDKLRPDEDKDQGLPTLGIGRHQVRMRGLLLNEEDENPSLSPLTIDPASIRPEALPLNVAWKDDTDPEWIRLRTVMDSGAAESVGPPSMAPGIFPIQESPGSKRGQAYIAAGHERIPNLGQQLLNVVTNEWQETQALFQIAEVTRPLTAVGTTCDRGNVVIYGPHGGCVLHLESGMQTDFVRRGGIYELDLWMKTDQSGCVNQQPGFPGPGR